MTEEILELIRNERIRQDDLWGDEFDSKNTPNDWVAYVTRYAGLAVTMPWNPEEFEDKMLKVAAIAVAALEQSRKNSGKMPPRHYDGDNQ